MKIQISPQPILVSLVFIGEVTFLSYKMAQSHKAVPPRENESKVCFQNETWKYLINASLQMYTYLYIQIYFKSINIGRGTLPKIGKYRDDRKV